jgi:hypothetical protein
MMQIGIVACMGEWGVDRACPWGWCRQLASLDKEQLALAEKAAVADFAAAVAHEMRLYRGSGGV